MAWWLGGGLSGAALWVLVVWAFVPRSPSLPDSVVLVSEPDSAVVRALVVLPYPPGQGPLAHYTEHLVWLPNLGRDARPEDRDTNAWTTPTAMGYWMSGTPQDLPSVLAALAGVFDPIDLSEDFAAEERDIILREYDWRMADNPDAEAALGMEAFLYDGNPVAVSVIGTPAEIAALSYEDAKAFHAATHLPERARLLVTGDVTQRDLAAALQTAGWPVDWAGPTAIGPPPFRLAAPDKATLILPEPEVRPRLAWRRVAALPRPVPFDLLETQAALLRDILDTNLEGGIAGPLRFDAAIANSFDLQIRPIDENHVELFFFGLPERDVSLTELAEAFESVLSETAASGIPSQTYDRVLDRFSGYWPDWSDPDETAHWMSAYAAERISALRLPLTREEVRALEALLRPEDIDTLLTALAGPGRTAIALIGKEDIP